MTQAEYEVEQEKLVAKLRNYVYDLDFKSRPDRSFAIIGDINSIAQEILDLPMMN